MLITRLQLQENPASINGPPETGLVWKESLIGCVQREANTKNLLLNSSEPFIE